MKILKKLVIIILIVAVLQAVGMIFVNNISFAGSDDFMANVSSRADAWKHAGQGQSNAILDNATEITNAITSIANVIRVVCVAIFLIRIAITAVKLSSDESPDHKAIAKKEVVFLAVLAVIFIFADKIINGLINFFVDFENIE